MNWTDRRRRFRAILKGDRCYHPGSVFDPLSARIAQDLGFEVGMFAGSTASLTVLGAPDLILITLSEFAGQAYRINRAFDLPLLVDADHGYGNALNVMRTVQELETAGVSALTIEDTVLPRPYGPAGRGLTSIEEGVGRMRAALAARRDPDLVIVGRTVAMGSTSTEDALARAKAYAAAGVDAFFFVGVKDRTQLDAAAAAIDIPIIIGGGAPELSDLDYLASRQTRVALQGHQPIMRDAVEVALEVGINHERVAVRYQLSHLAQCIPAAASRPKAVARRSEHRFEDRLECELHRRLDDAVLDRGNSQRPGPTITLRDLDPPDRLRPVTPVPQCRRKLGQIQLRTPFKPLDALTIHARRTFIGRDSLPSRIQRVGGEHLIHQTVPTTSFDAVHQRRHHALRPDCIFHPRPVAGFCTLCSPRGHCRCCL